MNIQSIFAITDFSTRAEQGLERAALLAHAHQATLSVMYATETPNPKFSDPLPGWSNARGNWPGATPSVSKRWHAPAEWWMTS